jgi:hypothetical protein
VEKGMIHSNKQICIAVAVEADKVNINSLNLGVSGSNTEMYYELEAIRLFSSWRKRGGWLKDINIYALCLTGNEPSKKTQDKFKQLNVNYISDYDSITETFECGYWNIPLAGAWFEKNLSEDIIIKLDLDMILLKPLKENLFDLPVGGCAVGAQDKNKGNLTTTIRQLPAGATYRTNTCLIISYRKSGIYQEWFRYLMELTNDYYTSTEFKEYLNNLNVIFDEFEEFSLEEMIGKNLVSNKIIPINGFQHSLSYPTIDKLTYNEFAKIHFWHEHIYGSMERESLHELIQFEKRSINNNSDTKIS